MELHLRCHTKKCYLSPDTSKHTHLNRSQWLILDLPIPEGWKAELT